MMTDNKELLDNLIEENCRVKELTYIELGMFLTTFGYKVDWISLAEAHVYLGGYKNDDRDNKIKSLLDKGGNFEVVKGILEFMETK
jgi:hypothetical protein